MASVQRRRPEESGRNRVQEHPECLQNLDDSLSHGRIDDDYFITGMSFRCSFSSLILSFSDWSNPFSLSAPYGMDHEQSLLPMLHTKQGRPDMLQGVNGVPPTVAATGVLAARSRFFTVSR